MFVAETFLISKARRTLCYCVTDVGEHVEADESMSVMRATPCHVFRVQRSGSLRDKDYGVSQF